MATGRTEQTLIGVLPSWRRDRTQNTQDNQGRCSRVPTPRRAVSLFGYRYKVPNIKVPNHKIPNNIVPNNGFPK